MVSRWPWLLLLLATAAAETLARALREYAEHRLFGGHDEDDEDDDDREPRR